MSPRRRWGVLLTLLAVAGVLALSERGGTPDNAIVADVPRKSSGVPVASERGQPARNDGVREVPRKSPALEPNQPVAPARAVTPATGADALALRSAIEIAGPIAEKPARAETNQAVPGARAQTPASGPMILAIRPRETATRIADSFAPHDWTPPPPRAKPAPPPPPPTAPPLPYRVIGKKFEDGAWQVFLARQDQVFVVKPRDTLENTYRIEETKPPLMTLTYLPLQQRQTLPIGGVE